jgi:type II secretory pathway component PulC
MLRIPISMSRLPFAFKDAGEVPRAATISAVVLGALLLADISRFALHAKSAWGVAALPDGPVAQNPAAPRGSKGLVRRIVRAHLFGTAPTDEAATSIAPAAKPPTWELTGTIASENPREGSAFLGATAEQARLWHTGAVIASGTQLREVYATYVVLDLDGQSVIVRLPRPLGPVKGLLLASADAPPRGEAAAESTEQTEPPVFDLATAHKPTAAEQVFEALAARPREVNGRVEGMEVHPPQGMQRRLKLHDGDVLTAVNGVPLTGSVDVSALLQGAEGSTIALTVMHDGQSETRRVPLSQ